MNQPALKDGDDDGSDELDIDFIPDTVPQFYWTTDKDEIRRAFIFDKMADPQIIGSVLVDNMEMIFQWLTKGTVPKAKKPHLKVAET